MKWLVVGGALVTAAAVGTVAVRATSGTPASNVARTEAPPHEAHVAPAAAPPLRAPEVPTADVASLPEAPAARAPAAHAPSAHAPSIAAQIAEMDRIRAAMASGDEARALAAIDAYESAHPRGAFVEEAEALRVEALARAGRRDDARRAAARFLARYPASPHVDRIRPIADAEP